MLGAGEVGLGALLLGAGALVLLAQTSAGGELARGTSRAVRAAAVTAAKAAAVL